MRIEIVLPRAFPDYPIGGYAVAYQYANRLTARGHDVAVQHVLRSYPTTVERSYRSVRRRWVDSGPDLARWFAFDPAVRLVNRDQIDARSCRRADAVIATGWQTAESVALAGIGLRTGYYLLQHHETWSADPDRVDATWRLPLTQLAISRWLLDLGRQLAPAVPRHHLPNAVDPDEMYVQTPVADRDPLAVGMLWHTADWKGSATGIEGFREARARIRGLHLTVFSASARPAALPEPIRWLHLPSRDRLRRFYNDISIFVSPSLSEGWALPPAEAMACGAALLTTDIPGVADYADPSDATLFPAGDAGALASALVGLVRDPGRRLALAAAGTARISRDFSWDDSVERLEAILAHRC